jgi:phage major head subunit gpT-like protein
MAGVYVGFNTAFQQGIGAVSSSSLDQVAMTVNSTTSGEKYGWMKDLPGFREWLGERVVNNVAAHDYSIKNKTFENTVGIDREKFEDDQFGTYTTLFKAMGEEAARFPSRLVFGFLKTANAQLCYDGQYLCDTDHPQIKPDGTEEQVSNYITGAGPAWYLMDLSRTLKPIVFQKRKPFDKLIRKDKDEDDNVFNQKQFLYGTDGRANVGSGIWQLIVMSKAALTPENYGIARAKFATFKKDYTADPIGARGTHLFVPQALEGDGRKCVVAENLDGGGSNPWKGTAQLVVEPYLD